MFIITRRTSVQVMPPKFGSFMEGGRDAENSDSPIAAMITHATPPNWLAKRSRRSVFSREANSFSAPASRGCHSFSLAENFESAMGFTLFSLRFGCDVGNAIGKHGVPTRILSSVFV